MEAAIRVRLTDGSTLLVDHVAAESAHSCVSVTLKKHGMTLTRHIPFSQSSSVRFEATKSQARSADQFVSTRRTVTQHVSSKDGPAVADDAQRNQEAPCAAATCSIGPRWMCPPLPVESRVIGVRVDPLEAYRDEVKKFYPHGVPTSEAGVALDLMRAAKEKQIFEGAAPAEEQEVIPLPPPPAHRDSIDALTVDVRPVSVAGRADWDALRLVVGAVDDTGQPTQVRGTLRATCVGTTTTAGHSYGEHFVGDPGRVVRLGTWTRSIDSHGKVIPVSVRLPLTRPLPDYDWRTAAIGDVHVQLLAPGQGVFETVREDVLLRHVGSLRERNIVETGSSCSLHAATAGRRMPAGIRFFSPSSLRPGSRVLSVQP
jgi:hypothetical protein